MIELKFTIDEIDYSGISELVLPILKEQLAEKETFLGDLFGKYIPTSVLTASVSGILKALSQEQKDALTIKIVEKYKDNIKNILQKAAKDRGVNLVVKDLSASAKSNL